MNHIASPQDLASELTKILAYCESSAPSRTKLASELNSLANRLSARKPVEILKRDWPELWPWMLEAYNFLSGDRLPKSTDHIVALKSGNKKLFQETLKRFHAEVSSQDLKDLQQMSPGVTAELDKMSKQMQRLAAAGEEDNSYGRGYFPLPHELASLGRFADALKPSNLVSHKVFPDEGAHMLTAKLSRVSVMAADMKSLLLRYGLLRIQSNEPGTLAFYFGPYPVTANQPSAPK